MSRPSSEDELQQIVDAVRQHGSIQAAARAMKLPRSTVATRYGVAKERGLIADARPDEQPVTGEKFEQVVQGDKWTIVSHSTDRIRTMEDALKFADVDLELWEVVKCTLNSHEVPMKLNQGEHETTGRKLADKPILVPIWQVKLELKRRMPKAIQDATFALFERMKLHAPKYRGMPKLKKCADAHMAEISIYDHHFGKLCWSPESGSNYDLKIAERLYLNAVDDLLAYWSNINIERYILPIGHDLLHVESDANTTTKGTPQDVDGRYAKVFETACSALIKAIDRLAERSEVEVLLVPGNHDEKSSWYLAKFLKAWYRQCRRVTVDDSPRLRKYREYGVCLFGYAHDLKENRLVGVMASEQPDAFARCQFKQWRLGHRHTKQESTHHTCDIANGVEVRRLPSMSGTDKWHFDNAFVEGRRTAEVWAWSKERGYVGHFSANARE